MGMTMICKEDGLYCTSSMSYCTTFIDGLVSSMLYCASLLGKPEKKIVGLQSHLLYKRFPYKVIFPCNP